MLFEDMNDASDSNAVMQLRRKFWLRTVDAMHIYAFHPQQLKDFLYTACGRLYQTRLSSLCGQTGQWSSDRFPAWIIPVCNPGNFDLF